jgi:hypothetical protein
LSCNLLQPHSVGPNEEPGVGLATLMDPACHRPDPPRSPEPPNCLGGDKNRAATTEVGWGCASGHIRHTARMGMSWGWGSGRVDRLQERMSEIHQERWLGFKDYASPYQCLWGCQSQTRILHFIIQNRVLVL